MGRHPHGDVRHRRRLDGGAVQGYTDDDKDWPDAGGHENDLGKARAVIDPSVPGTLGMLSLGPTTTDNGNAGFSVALQASAVAEPQAAEIRVFFDTMTLYEDEEWGDTHVALYAYRDANTEIFRWNDANNKVDEVATYSLSTGTPSTTVRMNVTGPTVIWVDGYGDDDQDWPRAGSNENSLGRATITVDPADPSTLGRRVIGPTTTDNGNRGFIVNVTVDVISSTSPNLQVTGVEVTQAVQYFRGSVGADNSLPLVANKDTLVRVYLDSGLDPTAPGGGRVPNVTGTLTATGSANFSATPLAPITAQPGELVDGLAGNLLGDGEQSPAAISDRQRSGAVDPLSDDQRHRRLREHARPDDRRRLGRHDG